MMAHAEGKLSLELPFYSSVEDNNPVVGLYVRERLSDKFFYQSWTGGRFDNYFTSWHGAMLDAGSGWGLGLGPQFFKSNSHNEFRGTFYIEKKLW